MTTSARYESVVCELKEHPKVWLITGVAGFIGSNLLETLLKMDQYVIGIDNFSTGFRRNLDEVRSIVSDTQWNRFEFYEDDVCSFDACKKVLSSSKQRRVNYVLHQAALGSVPRSIEDPINTNRSNVDGFLNMLVAAKDSEVDSFTFAASSSTYGDQPELPKVENRIGNPLSPYAVTKYVNEIYAEVFARVYGFKSTGLRYFNVFGPRQNPSGAYAAVIPKWTAAMIRNENVYINGDGETSRDFSYIDNAVQLNILAATSKKECQGEIYNMALGARTSLNTLFDTIAGALKLNGVHYHKEPIYQDFRAGDVRHSQADIAKAKENLGYSPTHNIHQGIHQAMPWYVQNIE